MISCLHAAVLRSAVRSLTVQPTSSFGRSACYLAFIYSTYTREHVFYFSCFCACTHDLPKNLSRAVTMSTACLRAIALSCLHVWTSSAYASCHPALTSGRACNSWRPPCRQEGFLSAVRRVLHNRLVRTKSGQCVHSCCRASTQRRQLFEG
jgi:hypothetical protein